MTVSSKIRIYDLAKELKLDTKRLIEEVRREGVDVSVPSNSVSKELAEKIRNKYFPKKEVAVKRAVKVVKRAARSVEGAPSAELEEPVKAAEPEHVEAEESPPPQEIPAAVAGAAKLRPAAKLMKKLPPAARAEQPAATGVETAPLPELAPEADDEELVPTGPLSADVPGMAVESSKTALTASRQIRVMRPTAAALNAGVRPGERAPSPLVAPITPKERAERSGRVRDRNSLSRTERLGTPGETATPLTTYIPPPDSGRRRSRRTPARGGRKVEGKASRFDKGDFI
ncbi:MAG: translation initiation factor IF-2 N-terminal domain-containing protein, partial [Acidobacteria bacterium]|nr:translation initiation factor IF-2 N-terminal domain-containing protein [Acidobacteriota bacterium]